MWEKEWVRNSMQTKKWAREFTHSSKAYTNKKKHWKILVSRIPSIVFRETTLWHIYVYIMCVCLSTQKYAHTHTHTACPLEYTNEWIGKKQAISSFFSIHIFHSACFSMYCHHRNGYTQTACNDKHDTNAHIHKRTNEHRTYTQICTAQPMKWFDKDNYSDTASVHVFVCTFFFWMA